ncbi:MAG TPA: NADH-quinone oxidoreductase subunit C [Planctomycetota bacterium]|nr:NADH-quinone oxidoreductase subunit C [Planctomycetota bacterium]
MKDVKEAIAILKEKFGERILEAVDAPVAATKEKPGINDPFVKVAPKDLVEVMTYLRDEPRLRFDLLNCLTGIDYPKESKLQVVYNLDSVPNLWQLTVKVDIPRDDPKIPTLENVFRTADWHEREAWDLVGIEFEGHHNLIRILCAEDWEGHPLRKDYVMPDYYHDIPNAFEMFYDVQNP